MKIGENIKKLRLKNAMTQKDLSEATNMKIAHISRIENDDGDPKLSTLYKIMNALNCTPNDMLIHDDSPMDMRLQDTIEKINKMPKDMKIEIMSIIEKYVFLNNTIENMAKVMNFMEINSEEKMDEAFGNIIDGGVELQKLLQNIKSNKKNSR